MILLRSAQRAQQQTLAGTIRLLILRGRPPPQPAWSACIKRFPPACHVALPTANNSLQSSGLPTAGARHAPRSGQRPRGLAVQANRQADSAALSWLMGLMMMKVNRRKPHPMWTHWIGRQDISTWFDEPRSLHGKNVEGPSVGIYQQQKEPQITHAPISAITLNTYHRIIIKCESKATMVLKPTDPTPVERSFGLITDRPEHETCVHLPDIDNQLIASQSNVSMPKHRCITTINSAMPRALGSYKQI